MRFFTHYWKNSTWLESQKNFANSLLIYTAGNFFNKRRISAGDSVYIVTVREGKLFLCGKLVVGTICGKSRAATLLGRDAATLWQASEFIVASRATPRDYNRHVSDRIAAKLRFVTKKDSTALTFVSPGHLDQQTLRTVRELDRRSASLLDGLLPGLVTTRLGAQ